MTKQTYAVARNGLIVHACPRTFDKLGPSVIRRWIADWETWADGIAKKYPSCPTSMSRRKTAFFIIDGIGKFDNRGNELAQLTYQ